MLQKTRFGDHFSVTGDTSVHYGPFDCAATMATEQYAGSQAPSEGGDVSASCC